VEVRRASEHFAVAVFLLPVWQLPAHACTIPVFRYALERWELTAYEIVVYHKAPLRTE